jgi:hypothetical protein
MEPAGSPSVPSPQQHGAHIARISAEAFCDCDCSSAEDVMYVFYSHADSDAATSNYELSVQQLGEMERCENFDALLTLLEDDCVDAIVFDPSIGKQEMQYITRWAHIFKPAIRSYELGNSGRYGNTAFLASTQF